MYDQLQRGGVLRGAILTWIAYQRNALQHADGPDDEGKVGGNLKGKIKGDLCQVSRQLPVTAQSH